MFFSSSLCAPKYNCSTIFRSNLLISSLNEQQITIEHKNIILLYCKFLCVDASLISPSLVFGNLALCLSWQGKFTDYFRHDIDMIVVDSVYRRIRAAVHDW